MKICHMLPSLKGGGIQNFIFSLIPEQVKLGHELTLIVTDEDDIEYSNHKKKELETTGVKVYNLNRVVSDKLSFFQTWITCRRILSKIDPDIVNSHGIYCHNAASFATMGSKIIHCCTIHSAPETWDLMTRWLNKKTPLIFCSDAALMLRNQESKVMEAINNGVDLSRIRVNEIVDLRQELGIPKSEKIVVLVGSPRPPKNYPFLIEIVKALNNEKIHFCICGGQYKVEKKGSNNDNYIDLEPFSIFSNIHLLGLRIDIPAILNGVDVYLSCSVREGLPISTLEGFFSGIPCVLSPIIQHKMIGESIDSCFIPKDFKAEDFVVSINQALKCTYSHDEIYQRRKPILKKFEIERCAKAYINFYKKILNEK